MYEWNGLLLFLTFDDEDDDQCCEVSCFSLLSGTETVPSGRVVHLCLWVRLDSLSLRTLSL